MESWDPVFRVLASQSTVFRFNRMGYGGAGKAPDSQTRDGVTVAEHLRYQLEVAQAKAPFVLVGHSLGGLYALCFARLYPDRVAGMLLLDFRPPAFSKACAVSDGISDRVPWYVRLWFPRHVKAEIDGARYAEQQAARPEDLGCKPVTVIAASDTDRGIGQRFFRLWQQEQRAFADRLGAGRYLIAENSTHYVHHDRPDLVVAEARRVCDRVNACFSG